MCARVHTHTHTPLREIKPTATPWHILSSTGWLLPRSLWAGPRQTGRAAKVPGNSVYWARTASLSRVPASGPICLNLMSFTHGGGRLRRPRGERWWASGWILRTEGSFCPLHSLSPELFCSENKALVKGWDLSLSLLGIPQSGCFGWWRSNKRLQPPWPWSAHALVSEAFNDSQQLDPIKSKLWFKTLCGSAIALPPSQPRITPFFLLSNFMVLSVPLLIHLSLPRAYHTYFCGSYHSYCSRLWAP